MGMTGFDWCNEGYKLRQGDDSHQNSLNGETQMALAA